MRRPVQQHLRRVLGVEYTERIQLTRSIFHEKSDPKITLSESQPKQLSGYARSHCVAVRLALRAKMILLGAEG